jgi:outer membrane protein assembly factor BamB
MGSFDMRLVSISAVTVLAAFICSATWGATSTITLTPASGHPNLAITIAGTAFGASEAIDVYVDTVDTLLLVSTSAGAFSASVTIPATAQPGTHYVTAIGRKSGDAAQLAFKVTTPWKELGYGAAHLGWNPYENTLSTSNVSALGPLWSVNVNQFGTGATPAISAGRVFVGTSAGLTAYSAATGAVLWNKLTTEYFLGSPAVIGNAVYIGGYLSGTMYAVNTTSGATIWSRTLCSEIYSSPVVVGGVLYFGCFDNDTVYALKAATGATLWTAPLGGNIDSSPAVVNGTVYIGASDDYIYALDAGTGAVNWQYLTGGAIESSPAVAGGVVYAGSDDGDLYAIRATGESPGTLLWSAATGGSGFATPAVANGIVFYGSSGDVLYAFNAHTGALLWSAPTGGSLSSAAVANGVVYAASNDDTLYAFAASNGAILTTAVTGSLFFGSPAISDGVLYINPFEGGNLTAFSLYAGTDARPPARPPPRSALHPDMNLAITSQRNIAWAQSNE